MGCGQSASGGNNADRDKAFRQQVAQGNALAVALNDHWAAYMKENEFKQKGDTQSCERLRAARLSKVQVNRNISQAESQKLSFEVASRVADYFLGHAMLMLTEKKWGGSVRHNLRGAAGKESVLAVSGSVALFDKSGTKYTVPYTVDYSFFLC